MRLPGDLEVGADEVPLALTEKMEDLLVLGSLG
jgi:hypothetical protein